MSIEFDLFKRVFDLMFSLFILVLVSPILLIIILIQFFTFGFSIFFIQKRIGFKGKEFKLIKFKSMKDSTSRDGKFLADAERLTFFGRILRSWSLDEFPQFINILMGDMSLIGPRPLLTDYLSLYTKEQFKRHDVKPGITGWAQVNGRNKISWEKKFELDLYYVRNKSFMLDLKILYLTIIKVLKRADISYDPKTTMQKFVGTKTK